MSLNYNITEEDYIQFNLYHTAHSPGQKKLVFLMRLLFPALGVLALIVAKYKAPKISWPILISIVLASIFGFLLFPTLFERSIRNNINRLLREGRKNEFVGPYSLYLHEDYIHLNSPSGASQQPYTNVERIANDGQRLYFYTGAITAIIVPLSAFSEPKDWQNFVKVISAKAGIS